VIVLDIIHYIKSCSPNTSTKLTQVSLQYVRMMPRVVT